MADNAQVIKILESINQKSKKCQDELTATIIDEFEDAVAELNDPLNRARQSLDKARETLDTSRGSMEAFEGRVNETLTKFEKVGADIANNTNDALKELKEVSECEVGNTRKLIENSSTLENRMTEISSLINEFREENKAAAKASLEGVNSKLLKVSEEIETQRNEIQSQYEILFKKFNAIIVNMGQNNEKFILLGKETQQYKDLAYSFQKKYEQSEVEASVFKNKVGKLLYVAVALGIVNLVLIMMVLSGIRF